MSPITLALACLALCAGAARAATPPLPDPADPRAAVPPTAYQAAIRYRTEPPAMGTPDRNWVASNAAVTRGAPTAMAARDADKRRPPSTSRPPADGKPMHDMHGMHGMHNMHEMHETPTSQPMPGAAHQHGEAP